MPHALLKSVEIKIVKIGDLIKLPEGCFKHYGLASGVAVLVAKLPRADNLEYDWFV